MSGSPRPPLIEGKLFRGVNKGGRTWGDGLTERAVWHMGKSSENHRHRQNLGSRSSLDVRARLCHASGGELEQVQFLLRQVSVQTSGRYLGCKQRIRSVQKGCRATTMNPGSVPSKTRSREDLPRQLSLGAERNRAIHGR
jgi:hypothetical protein